MEGKNIQVLVDGVPKFNISVTKDTKIGEIKKILSRIDYKTVEMEVYPGKSLPKVFETDTYDKTNLKSVYNKLRDSKIYLATKASKRENNEKSQKTTISQIDHAFPTGNKPLDIFFLTQLDDKTLLNTLNTNKSTKKYADSEDLWRNRFLQRYPKDFETVQKKMKRKWKDFSLLLIKYLYLSKENYDEAMELAAKDGHRDLVDFFISKGADDWDYGMHAAAQGGHRDLVDFFISKGADEWDLSMKAAAKGGHRDLVEFFISKGADDWPYGMEGAAQGGHRDLVDFFISKGENSWNSWNWAMRDAAGGGHRKLVDFFISKGANKWDWGMQAAARGGHRDLVDFFISKGAKQWQSAVEGAAVGGHIDLVKFFATKSKNIDWDKVMFEAITSGYKDIVELAVSKGAKRWKKAMTLAIEQGRLDLVKIFISKGHDFNFDRALGIAKSMSKPELVEFFQNEIMERE